jgi:hypothetical protein
MTRNCKWLQARFEERYETKWFGFNRKNDSESSEKSKTFVGIRTEINHVNKIFTFANKQYDLVGTTSIEGVFRRSCTAIRSRSWKRRVQQQTLNFTSVSDQRLILAYVAVQARPDVRGACSKGSSPSQRSGTRM